MRHAVHARLASDLALMELLSGGIHIETEISRVATPIAFDQRREVKPCGLLRTTQETSDKPYRNSIRLFVDIYLYERVGYTVIDQARMRIYDLLHQNNTFQPQVGNCWEVRHNNDLLDQTDEALGCSMILSRYTAIVSR